MNQYYFDLAKKSAEIAGDPVKAEYIFCQWKHETGDFSSALCLDYNNLGGITTTTPNDLPQPDGELWYRKFDTPEDYADFFGRYLKLYAEDGMYEITCLEDYVKALKHGGYFGDSLENYLANTERIYAEEFG